MAEYDKNNVYAKNVEGDDIHISEAKSGRKGYYCLRCTREMEAVKQTIQFRTSYFRHVAIGAKVPLPHYHEYFDETVYGLEGVMTFTVDGKTIELEKGQSLFIPKGIVHGFNNLSQQNARALAVATPGLIGAEYFQELAVIINAGGPPDIEKIKAVFKKHGLVPVMSL